MENYEVYRKQEIEKIDKCMAEAFRYAQWEKVDPSDAHGDEMMLANIKWARGILDDLASAVTQARRQAREDADYINVIK